MVLLPQAPEACASTNSAIPATVLLLNYATMIYYQSVQGMSIFFSLFFMHPGELLNVQNGIYDAYPGEHKKYFVQQADIFFAEISG
jgi:hypothetical protein